MQFLKIVLMLVATLLAVCVLFVATDLFIGGSYGKANRQHLVRSIRKAIGRVL